MYEYRIYEGISVLPLNKTFLQKKKVVLKTKNPSDLYDFFKKMDGKYKKHTKHGGKNTRSYISKKQFSIIKHTFSDGVTREIPRYETIKEFVAIKYNTKTDKYSYWIIC